VKLSVLIPCFNERNTIQEIVRRVKAIPLDVEIIIVDDGSTDGTPALLEEFKNDHCKILFHDRNRGKGTSIRTALPAATGDLVVIQDADLEYDPQDLLRLVEVFREKDATVVYGSRNLLGNARSYSTFYWGGRVVSWLTTLLYWCHITDEPTCYKMFRTDLLKSLDLKCEGFEFCPEVTAKVLRLGHKIVEVPISYSPRDFAGGKKIRWTDGFQAIWVLIRYRLFR
jgi:glycosyltransferase involved in cell wall biosynthesis